jgi:hypothetical protein
MSKGAVVAAANVVAEARYVRMRYGDRRPRFENVPVPAEGPP